MTWKEAAFFVHKIGSRLHNILMHAPRGHGKPVLEEIWSNQYREGAWEYLGSLDEMGHYMIIHGYIYYAAERLGNRPIALLDVGCGHGQLLHNLSPSCLESYLGIDFSQEAIDRAHSLTSENVRFLAVDMERWEGDRRFDLIIFNEVLYYASEPVRTMERYRPFLRDNGLFVVSMCKKENHYRIFRKIDNVFRPISSIELTANRQQTWRVQLIDPNLPVVPIPNQGAIFVGSSLAPLDASDASIHDALIYP